MPELAVQRRHGLGPDALQVEQVEDGRRKLGQQLAMKGRAAGVGDLADSRGQILPDAWNLAQPGFVERGELMRMVRGDVGAVAIRANLERVVALDLQEIRNLPENARDRQVIQAGARPSRCDSRARRAPPSARAPAMAGRADGRTVAEEAPAAAGAADLGGGRARGRGARDQVLDHRRRHARREALPVVPLDGDLPADLVPVARASAPRASRPPCRESARSSRRCRDRRRCAAW